MNACSLQLCGPQPSPQLVCLPIIANTASPKCIFHLFSQYHSIELASGVVRARVYNCLNILPVAQTLVNKVLISNYKLFCIINFVAGNILNNN